MNKRLFFSMLPYAFIGLCLLGVLLILMIPGVQVSTVIA